MRLLVQLQFPGRKADFGRDRLIEQIRGVWEHCWGKNASLYRLAGGEGTQQEQRSTERVRAPTEVQRQHDAEIQALPSGAPSSARAMHIRPAEFSGYVRAQRLPLGVGRETQGERRP